MTVADIKALTISNQEFLAILFGPDISDLWVTDHHDWAGGFVPNKLSKLDPLEANYFSAARIKPGSFTRSNATFESGIVIVLDDVGTKFPLTLAENFAPEPTYKILTSEGNEQWGYVLIEPVSDPLKWHAFYELLRLTPFQPAADNSGLAAYKRLPNGLASKPEKRGFRTRLTHWTPTTRFYFDELAAQFGLDLSPTAIAQANIKAPPMVDTLSAEPLSQELLRQALAAIPNDSAFETRESWVHMGHSIYGASGGAEWGLEIWEQWCDQQPQKESPEKFWRKIKKATVRSGAGFIRQHLERVGNIELLVRAKTEGLDFFNATGISFDDTGFKQGGPIKKKAVAQRADQIQPEAISWIWDGYLAKGKLHLLAGASTTGKTTVALNLVAAVTTGGYWPDGARAPLGNAIIWSGEDGVSDTLVPRLILSGANLTRVHILSGVEENGNRRPFDPAKDMQSVAGLVEDIGGAAILIVDPIMSAIEGDSHKANDVRRALQPLVDLGERFGLATIGITHFVKNISNRTAMNSILGSQAFGALARIVHYCFSEQDPETAAPKRRVFVRGNSNIGADGGAFEYKIELGSFVAPKTGEIINNTHAVFGAFQDASADSIIASMMGGKNEDEGSGRPADERVRAEDFLRDFLKDGPRDASETKETAYHQACVAEATLRRARMAMGIQVTKKGKKWVWELPNEADLQA